MFITRKHLSRRTVLRGIGASVALPLLDSMVAAQTPARTVAPKTRFAAFYVPHGATMDKWTPAAEGAGFEFTDTLKPLEQFRDRVTVVSGLAHPYVAGAGGADVSAGANHTRAAAVFLTGSVPQRGPQAHLGVSADQVAAQHIGQDTPLPSLELSIEESVLTCEASFSCAYRNSISWKSPTQPLPMQSNPRLVFEKLFGDGATPAERRGRRQDTRSLLDSVMAQLPSLQRDLPPGDRRRLDQYLEDVREIERRIQRAEAAAREDVTLPDVPDRRAGHLRRAPQADDGPAGAGLPVGHHARIHLDVRARAERRRLPRDDHPRPVPQPVAPLERPRQHGSLRDPEPLPHDEVRLLRRSSCRRRRTATGRCSITRWCSTAAR